MAQSEDICMSLDDYIKKRQVKDTLCLVDYRKKERIIDKDEIDAELDMIAQKNANKRNGRKTNGTSKFDRFNDDDTENESDDDDTGRNIRDISDDVQMMDLNEAKSVKVENSSIQFAKEIQKMDHPECCQIKKHFKTVESINGIKVQSQQWRLQNGEQPSQAQNNMNKIRKGRVGKNYKQQIGNTKAGLFIEKGNFTYKFAETDGNDSDENAESIVGIVRNKPVTKIISNNFRRQNYNNQQAPVNINMNWNGFFKGMTNCVETLTTVSQQQNSTKKTINNSNSLQDKELKIAAQDLLEYYLAKRAKTESASSQNSSENSRYSPPVNEYIINAKAGDGIDGMNIVPKTTNLPMNLRFA